MKFEKKLATAAALAAMECVGPGCTPLKTEIAAPKTVETASLKRKESVRGEERMRLRFEQEIEEAISECVAAGEPARCLAELPPHTQDLLVVRVFKEHDQAKTPELIKALQPRLKQLYARDAEDMVRQGQFISAPDGAVRGISGPKGALTFPKPVSPFEAFETQRTYNSIMEPKNWSAPPQALSPYLLVGHDWKGADVIQFNKPSLNESTAVRRVSEGTYEDGRTVTYRAIPNGALRIEAASGGGAKLQEATETVAKEGMRITTTELSDRVQTAIEVPRLGLKFVSLHGLDNQAGTVALRVKDRTIRVHLDAKGLPTSSEHSTDEGLVNGNVQFDANGLPIAESPREGSFRVFTEKGEVGTFDEERKKTGFTREVYAKKLGEALKSPRHWLAYARAHRSSATGSREGDPFKADGRTFAVFTRDVLKAQGISAGAMEVPGIGSGVMWIVNRGNDTVDVFALGQGRVLKNFVDVHSNDPDRAMNRPPYAGLKAAFLDAVDRFGTQDQKSKAGTLFDLWKTLDGTLPVLVRTEEGKIETEKIDINDIIN